MDTPHVPNQLPFGVSSPFLGFSESFLQWLESVAPLWRPLSSLWTHSCLRYKKRTVPESWFPPHPHFQGWSACVSSGNTSEIALLLDLFPLPFFFFFFCFPHSLTEFSSNLLNKITCSQILISGSDLRNPVEGSLLVESIKVNVFPRKGKVFATWTQFCLFGGSSLLLD